MKIKLSRSQWEIVGKKAGWIKQATRVCGECGAPVDPKIPWNQIASICPFCEKETVINDPSGGDTPLPVPQLPDKGIHPSPLQKNKPMPQLAKSKNIVKK